MMSQEELLLKCWRSLGPAERVQVLQFTQQLQAQRDSESVDQDFGAPEHLKIRSTENLNALLQEGLESLDRGEGIEATEEWWEQERARLIARSSSNAQP